MVKSTTTSITPAQHAASHQAGGTDPFLHADEHRHGGGDVLTGDVRIDLQMFTTVVDVTASRTEGNVYQNSFDVPMLVIYSGRDSAKSHVEMFVENATPPTIAVSTDTGAIGGAGCVVAIVLPNYYYKITTTHVPDTQRIWMEYH